MKKPITAVVGGICLGAGLYYTWRWLQKLVKIRNFHLTNMDLDYTNRSAQQLAVEHLIDLNTAEPERLAELGLSSHSLERLVQERPYRTKLELVSRMVLSQDEYSAIKDKVSVAEAREGVKIA